MRGQKSQSLLKNLVASFIAIALLVSGAFFFGADGNVVLASDSEATTVNKNTDGYYVKPYTAEQFASFRGDTYTYPKLTVAEGSDYQEWLFAGWFTDEACTTANAIESSVKTVTGNVYAKFVDADLSYIKCQVTPGTEQNSELAHMRLISAVESNDYSGTGFYITYKGRDPRRCPSTTVYRRLSATEDGMECAYSPIAFNEDAEYLSAIRLTNISNTNFDEAFYIQSYWVTLDGTEVLGMSRYARIEDSYEKIVNVPVRLYASDVQATTGSVSVSYEPNQFSLYTTDEYNGYDAGKEFTVTNVDTTTSGKITVSGSAVNGVAEGLFVNLRLKLKEGATLESYTEFTVDNETFADVTGLDVSNVIFKNYPLAYNGTPDTSWYQGFENNKTFVITSAADLYGFASIVNAGTDTFKDNTVYLGADITVNKGQATASGWDTTKDVNGNTISDGTEHKWTPIGYTTDSAKRFQGVFDGCGNTIEGIYCVDDYENRTNTQEHYTGLFGITVAGSTVRNFKLTNSYFECNTGSASTWAFMGSVVGQLAGNIDSVYSNAIVKSIYMAVGGIAGRVNPGAAPAKSLITNCWFDGDITITQEQVVNYGVGGMVGVSIQGGANITDCLNTANITYSAETKGSSAYLNIGGIKGSGDSVMTNCVNAGTVAASIQNGAQTPQRVVSISATGTVTNCIDATGTKTADYNGYQGYVKLTTEDYDFKFYDLSKVTGVEGAEPGNWVCRATADSAIDGIPVLKSFCDEWIDVSWYYDTLKSNENAKEFIINSAEALYGWSELDSKAGITFAKDKTIKLGADIKLNSGTASVWKDNQVVPSRVFTPIGKTTLFAGTFDGQGKTISGLYVDNTQSNCAGLFAQVSGKVQNFRLENSYINSTQDYTGGVVGFLSGDIDGVYSDAYVKGKAATGGLVGRFGGGAGAEGTFGSLSNSWFAGTVQATGNYAGGIVGDSDRGNTVKTIQNCLNTGSVEGISNVGGIIGGAYSNLIGLKVSNCLTTGSVKGTGTEIGAVLGRVTKPVTFENVYTTVDKGGTLDDLRITGVGSTNLYATVTGEPILLTTANVKGNDAYIYTDLEFYDTDHTDNVWAIVKDGTPVIKALYDGKVETSLSGQKVSTSWYYNAKVRRHNTTDTPELKNVTSTYSISDEADLFGLATLVNGNKELFAFQTIYLEADVDMSQRAWEPIGNATYKFAGTFDGQKTQEEDIHTIRGINVNSSAQYTGLFGYTAAGSTVRDFRLEDSTITSSKNDTGSIIGCMEGNIEQVYSEATVNGTGQNVGGIVGRITANAQAEERTIKECWFAGTVTSTKDYHGGLVGRVSHGTVTIQDCLNTGEVINKYSYVNPSDNTIYAVVGGFVGAIRPENDHRPIFNIKNCINTGTVKAIGSAGVGSVIGRAFQVYRNTIENVYTTDSVKNIAKDQGVSSTDVEFLTTNNHYGIGSHSNQASENMNGRIAIVTSDYIKDKNAYFNTDLSFSSNSESGVWVAIEGATPELKAFSNNTIISDFGDGLRKSTDWYYNKTNWNKSAPLTNTQHVYTISDEADFYGFAELVNRGVEKFSGKTVSLADDIKMNGDVTDEIVNSWTGGTVPTNTWTPIKDFAGTFNGQGKTISGVYLKTEISSAGLFANLKGGVITNFSLKDSYFNSTYTNTSGPNAAKGAFFGSIVGISEGTVSKVYSDAIVTAAYGLVGGIVGQMKNSSSVDECWFDGKVTLTSTYGKYSGGIVGHAYATTTDVIFNITNCLYTGEFETKASSSANDVWGIGIGGILGQIGGGSPYTVNITNCLSSGKINIGTSGDADGVAIVLGCVDSTNPTVNLTNVYGTNESCTKAQRIRWVKEGVDANVGDGILMDEKDLYGTSGYVQLNTTLDFVNTWAARSNGVPGLRAFVEDPLTEEEMIIPDITWYNETASSFEIYTEEQMYGFMELMLDGKTFKNKTVTLKANLDMNVVEDETTVKNWKAGTEVPANRWSSFDTEVAKFAGAFDGENHIISGLYCVGERVRTGLFGYVATEGSIKNFRLTNSYFNHTNTSGCAGSVAAELYGSLENVYSNAIVDSKAQITAGLAAVASGPAYNMNQVITEDETEYQLWGRYTRDVKNCWFDGEVNATITQADARVGGFVGKVTQGKVNLTNCLFTGTISSEGTNSTTRIGGFVGSRDTKTVKDTSKQIKYVYLDETTSEHIDAHTTVNIDSSIAAGKIVASGEGAEICAALGKADYGKFTNVFVTRDTYPIPHACTNTYEGNVIQTYNTDRLIGYCVEPTYGFALDFVGDDATWSMRKSGVPIPKVFESVVGEDKIVADLDALSAEIGLEQWNKTLADAVDFGMGNYVISAEATSDQYSAYLKTLGDLGFELYANNEKELDGTDSAMKKDGVYNAIYTKADGDWVLNITFVQKEGKIYISISTISKDGLDDNLLYTDENIAIANATNATTKEVSFSMLELQGKWGNSFVFKLPNGHFIINDGGKKKASDVNNLDPLLDYLQELAESKKVVIDAWIFTHSHDDHMAIASDIFGEAEWKENVSLNAIYLTEANYKTKLIEGASARVIEDTNEAFRGLLSLTQDDNKSKPAIYRMHMGERYYFSGLTMDVVQAHEQIAYEEYDDYDVRDGFNTTSTNCVYTLTNTGKKILIGGDSNNANMQYMMEAYGKNYTTYSDSGSNNGGASYTLANINYFVVYHHGKNAICKFEKGHVPAIIGSTIESTATNQWANYLLHNVMNDAQAEHKFDAVLFPWYQVFDMKRYEGEFISHSGTVHTNVWGGDDGSIIYPYNISQINQYYIDNSHNKTYYTYGYQDHDADGNILELDGLENHGTVRIIFKDDKTVEHPNLQE